MDRSDYLEAIPAVQRLFRCAFHRDVPASYLQWRLADDPDSQPLVTIEQHHGQVVAHYGSTPLKMSIQGEQRRATLSVLGMTDPDCRGQGRFLKVFRAHEAELKRQDFAFTYGFPNRNSDPIFLTQLGWLPVYEIPTYYLELARIRRLRPDMGRVIFDDRFERFNYDAFVERGGLICHLRDAAYLRWRYTNHPVHRYRNLVVADSGRIAAYGVCKIYTPDRVPQLDLVDYFARDLPALETLMAAVCKHALDNDCVGINTWSPRHHFSHNYFNAIGFEYQLPVTNMGLRSFDDNLTPQLRQFSNWWVTMGDSDVY
jgi:hypothetical protein